MAAMTPDHDDMQAARMGVLSLHEYRRRFVQHSMLSNHAPGALSASVPNVSALGGVEPSTIIVVSGGDTLCCACSRNAATKGECHRVWAAELLQKAGWGVVLDGVVL